MKHQVFIPYSNEEVYDGWTRDVRLEIWDWLDNNIGSHDRDWTALFRWPADKGPAIGIDFMFKESSHAVMFKLTWAGR